MRAHDRVAQAEARRQQPVSQTGYTYKTFNLINNMSFGSGCRCSYDPNIDGGDYELLAAAKREKSERNDAGDGVHDSNATEMKDEGATNRESDDSDSDDEFDYLLDEEIETAPENGLQAQRRAELEYMARQYEVLRYHGYGVHRQMHPQRVFRSHAKVCGSTFALTDFVSL